jgi:hypothetical protein
MELLERKDPKFFSPDLKKIISYISLKENTQPVGSFKYESFKYPGDIDIFESVEVTGTKKEAAEKFARRFYIMMIRMKLSSPKIYFYDFKAGFDLRFKALLDAIEKKNKKTIRSEIGVLMKKEILRPEFHDELLRLLENKNYEELHGLIDNKYKIRWTFDELTVFPPVKTLDGNKEITLSQALMIKSKVKLDVWAVYNNRLVEMTNMFNLYYIHENDKHVLTEPLDYYAPEVAQDILIYKEKDMLKCLKRLWILCAYVLLNLNVTHNRQIEMLYYIQIINPLLQNTESKLNQIKTDYQTIVNFCCGPRRIHTIPVPLIKEKLLELLIRIYDTIEEQEDIVSTIHDAYDEIFNGKMNIHNSSESDEFIQICNKNLVRIIDTIDIYVKQFTKAYIKKNKIDLKKVEEFATNFLNT